MSNSLGIQNKKLPFLNPLFMVSNPYFLCFKLIFIGGLLLYNIVMVLAIHLYESVTGTHLCPHPEPPSHLHPHPIPLGCPRTLTLGSLLHASNLQWSSDLHMVIHVCQC